MLVKKDSERKLMLNSTKKKRKLLKNPLLKDKIIFKEDKMKLQKKEKKLEFQLNKNI